MNPVQRFFRRYITSTIGILLLFFAVNIALLLGILTVGYMSGPEDDVSIQEIQAHLTLQDGIWTADETAAVLLQENDAWAMLLDQNGAVVWEQGLPEELPRAYTSAEIAAFSRWYLQDYPVKVWGQPDGMLMVVGFAPGTQAKYYFSMETAYLKMLLVGAATALLINLLLLVILFLRNTRRVEKAMSPILQGIQALSRGQRRHLEECGELAEINAELNRAGEYLMQKDNTRAEWIRGVSHDIRTPLSMVLGYASGAGGQRRPPRRGPAAGRDHPAAGRAAEIPGGRFEPDHQTGVCPPTCPPGDGRSGRDRPPGGERGAQRWPAGAL